MDPDLVLPIVLLAQPEYSVAESEDVFVGCVLGISQLLYTQQGALSVVGLHKGSLQDSEELLQNVLLSQQFLPVPVARGHDLERVLAVLLVLLVRQKVDDVLQKARQRPGNADNKNTLKGIGKAHPPSTLLCVTKET